MSLINCNSRCSCALWAIIAKVIVGVITVFLQITGVITATAAFLWVTFGIAVVYLGIFLVASVFGRAAQACECKCATVNTLPAGILGTILFSVVLLAVGVVATSVVSAILVELLPGFFALTLSATACYVRCLTDCAEQATKDSKAAPGWAPPNYFLTAPSATGGAMRRYYDIAAPFAGEGHRPSRVPCVIL